MAREALAADPDLGGAHAALSFALSATKRARLGLQSAETALACAPNAAAFQAKSFALDKLGRRKPALAAARESVALSPDNAPYANQYAIMLEKAGKAREAEAEFARAVSLAAGNDRFRASYGLFLIRNRKLAEAALVADTVAQSDHSLALLLRGNVALRRHRPQEAQDYALWVLSQDAGNQAALTLLVSAKAAQSRGMALWWRYHVFVARQPKWVRVTIGACLMILIFAPVLRYVALPAIYYLGISRRIFAGRVKREIQAAEQSITLKKSF